MTKYVKRSIAVAAVAISFVVGFPANEVATKLLARLWTLYGAYIGMWWEQYAAFFVVPCLLCGAVVLLYGVILLPLLSNRHYQIDAEDVDSVPIHSLKVHFNIIRETIDFAQLLPQLYQDRILSYEEEIAKIQSENSRALQTMSLVHMIEKKGKAGVKGFIESLERETTNIGHRDLAQELKNEYPELFPTQNKGMCTELQNQREGEEGEPSYDAVIDTTLTVKSKPRLHLDSVMDVSYSFTNNEDPCHQKLISWGLQMFPPRPLDNTLFIAACLVGNFEFPLYYDLVSPVFYFWSEDPIPDSIKFDMQHSVDAKTRKQATCLSFVSADVSTGPPFIFNLVNGGEFNPNSSSGVISTKPQGLLAIVKRKLGRLTLRTDPQLKYVARVYYTWDTPMEYECTAHFVITPATKAWDKVLEEHFRDAIKGDKKDVSFVKSCISVVVPDEGLFVKGWAITCTSSKTIHYEAVGKATDRLVIPECKLSIKWVGEEGNEELLPSDLHCNISFTGSHQKKSESYFHLHSRCSQGNELKAGIW